jgi:hypothetical protein
MGQRSGFKFAQSAHLLNAPSSHDKKEETNRLLLATLNELTKNNEPLVRIKSVSSHMREQEPHPFAPLEIKFNGSLVLHHVNFFKPDRD